MNSKYFKLKEVTIRDTYTFIEKLKPLKCRVNKKNYNLNIKQLPHFMSVAMTHFFNNMLRTSEFPNGLKV